MKVFLATFLVVLLQVSIFAQTVNNIVWVTEDYPPFNYMEDGNLKGTSVETLEAIWKKVGITKSVKDVQVHPWARGVKMANTQPNTCLFATTLTLERKSVLGWKFVYPIPQLNDESKNQIIARKDKKIKFNSVDDLKKYAKKFGVVRGDVGAGLLLEVGLNSSKFDEAGSPESLLKKLDAGRYDVISYSSESALIKMKKLGIDANKYETVFTFANLPMGYAFHKSTDQALIAKFQKALDELYADGTIDKIKAKYMK